MINVFIKFQIIFWHYEWKWIFMYIFKSISPSQFPFLGHWRESVEQATPVSFFQCQLPETQSCCEQDVWPPALCWSCLLWLRWWVAFLIHWLINWRFFCKPSPPWAVLSVLINMTTQITIILVRSINMSALQLLNKELYLSSLLAIRYCSSFGNIKGGTRLSSLIWAASTIKSTTPCAGNPNRPNCLQTEHDSWPQITYSTVFPFFSYLRLLLICTMDLKPNSYVVWGNLLDIKKTTWVSVLVKMMKKTMP